MGEGSEYAKRNSKFIKLGDGDSFEGVYEGRKYIIKDIFGEEKEVGRYKISGKSFDSQSGALAISMDEINIGDKIRITRSGEGTETTYKIEKIDNDNDSGTSQTGQKSWPDE